MVEGNGKNGDNKKGITRRRFTLVMLVASVAARLRVSCFRA